MKKKTRKLGLTAITMRHLTHTVGGIEAEPLSETKLCPRERTYGCPSKDDITCQPKPEGPLPPVPKD